MGLLETDDLQHLRLRFAELRAAGPGGGVAALRRRLHDDNEAFGLRRDLRVPFEAPPARLELRIRELEDRDVPDLLDPGAPGLTDDDREERRSRQGMLRAGLRTAWVAVDPDDRPVYVQWLLGPDQNAALARRFGGNMPVLGPDEALLEGAYTPVRARGQRVMPHAMARIAERAADLGARHVLTFVTQDNAASLAGCERAGFVRDTTRTVTFRAFRRRVVFAPLPR